LALDVPKALGSVLWSFSWLGTARLAIVDVDLTAVKELAMLGFLCRDGIGKIGKMYIPKAVRLLLVVIRVKAGVLLTPYVFHSLYHR
jgi:hypothetical protein